MAKTHPVERIRNIGIIAHIDAGKTTVSERILFYTGLSHKIGEVHEGEATMDWMEQERERGITITAAATTTYWTPTYANQDKSRECRINIIDTPGHIDFTAEVQRSLRVLDGAIVVFDGVAGVEPQSETVWHQADKFGVPRVCFINKLDRLGASFDNSLKSIHERLSPNAVVLNIPIGLEGEHKGIIDLIRNVAVYFEGGLGEQISTKEIPEELKATSQQWREKMFDSVASLDDKLAEQFLAGQEIPIETIRSVIRRETIAGKIFPVFCGSALKNKGVQLVLDGVVDYLPSPIDLPPVKGINPKSGQEETREPKDDAPFSALAFKVASDPFVGALTYFRVYSGTLKRGSYIYNVSKGETERIGRLLRMHANQREEIEDVFAGGIAATVGLKNTSTGDTLSDQDHPILLEKIEFPEPVISIRVEPQTKSDQEKLGLALKRLSEEDPTFRRKTDQETGEMIVSGMGEVQLEVIVDRLKREFKVGVNVGKPQVAYKETITKEVEIEGKYIRQSGGRGQYGHVWLRLKPLERGKGFEFVNEIKGGIVPNEFIPAVEKGVEEALDKGVVAGYPLQDLQVTLYDGSYHEVDSSEAAFKIAGSIALQEGSKKAGPVILEPIMKVEVVTPDDFLGDVTGDLSARRGQIENITSRSVMKVIHSFVPLANMFGYVTNLRSMTEGRATYSMEFDHYAEVPQNIAQEIISGRQK
ncbi:elongation factor G [Candidatus Parcubacteria bacterium]|nr:MAG: elongation factor G [Candidatus Parcubacteria bacterium]